MVSRMGGTASPRTISTAKMEPTVALNVQRLMDPVLVFVGAAMVLPVMLNMFGRGEGEEVRSRSTTKQPLDNVNGGRG